MTQPDPAWLDRMYDNRARWPGHPAYFQRWARDSARVRATQACMLDVAYGDGPQEVLDVFPAADARASAPVLFFIHGGYWRALDKRDHSFIAPVFTAQDVCVVVPNYALCPGTDAQPVTVADIALQMTRALAWTWRHIARHGGDPARITVAGHSAGGHLAAMLLACRWPLVGDDLPPAPVRNALSISGLYDMEPFRHAPFIKDSLRLTAADVPRLSPMRWAAPAAGPLHSLVGGDESEEYQRQNESIARAWGAQAVPVCEVLPGCDHFAALDTLADPAGGAHRRAMELLRASWRRTT
jgi:arylformamidase